MSTRTLKPLKRDADRRRTPMVIIRLCGQGGELDSISLCQRNATTDAISRAVRMLATRCTLDVGDRITVTEE